MSKPYIIGITGGSGSGKTTFIHEIRNSFTEKEVCIISQDEYYRPRKEQLKDEQGITNFDLPYSIDKKAFLKDLKRLMKGKTVKREEYTFNNALKNPKILTYHPAPIVIVEGLFIYHFKKISALFDLKVFLHAKENLKVIRRIKRDRVERNYPLEDVLYRYENHVLPTYEKYISPYKDDCDIVINNNIEFDRGLEVVIGFLQSRLVQS